MRVRVGVLGVATLFLALLTTGVAAAHVGLVTVEVRAGAAATHPELVLEFSAALDHAFSTVKVLDSQGQLVDAGPGALDPDSPDLLVLPLGGVAPGDYEAIWRVRSQDGHVAQGADRFTIPAAATPPPLTSGPTTSTTATSSLPATPTTSGALPPTPPSGSAGEPGSGSGSSSVSGEGTDGGRWLGEGSTTSLWEAPLRWFSYAGTAVLIGAVVFLFAVWHPATGTEAEAEAEAEAEDTLIVTLRTAVRVASAVLLVDSLALIVVQAAYAADVTVSSALGRPLWDILGTYSGRVWIARVVLILVALVAGWTMAPRYGDRRWWVILASGLGVLLTFSLVSHASMARHPALSVAVDWVHLVAMTAWMGGLVALTAGIVVLRRRRGSPNARALVMRRFSSLALACVAVLAVTGTYSATEHFAALGPLFTTAYGRVLLAKLALFGILLLFGAANKFVLIPRISVSGGTEALSFTVPSEAAVGALLLLVVGFLTSIAPG